MGKQQKKYVLGLFLRSAIVSTVVFHLVSCQKNLTGVVLSELEKPIIAGDVSVNIVRLDDGDGQDLRLVVFPDKNGYFETEKSLPKGSYLVEVLTSGYKTSSMKVDIADKPISLKILLQQLKDSTNKKTIHSYLNIPSSRAEGGVTLTPPKL